MNWLHFMVSLGALVLLVLVAITVIDLILSEFENKYKGVVVLVGFLALSDLIRVVGMWFVTVVFG